MASNTNWEQVTRIGFYSGGIGLLLFGATALVGAIKDALAEKRREIWLRGYESGKFVGSTQVRCEKDLGLLNKTLQKSEEP